MEKIFLVMGITGAASIFVFLLINDWMLGFAGITGVFLLSVLIVDPLDSRTKNERENESENANEIMDEEEEGFGNEVVAAVDSRS